MDNEGVPGRAPRQDQLLEEASLWFARMRGPDAETFRPAFEHWLALGAAHLGAYNRAGEVFALGKFLAETPDQQTMEARNRLEPAINWRLAMLAACVLLVLGAGLWFNRSLIATQFGETVPVADTAPRDTLGQARIITQDGMRRTLILPDGSTVTLEAGSVLATRYGSERRVLRLERGRARFEVAHEQRPFVVLAGNGSVTARGTIFDVIVDGKEGVTVHLLRGAIDVERTPNVQMGQLAQPIVTRLEPGESLNFGMGQTSLAQSTPRGRALDAGPGAIAEAVEFEKAPLSQVIDRANQVASTSIRLADPAIGELRVSGRFRIDEPDQLAERLASLFGLESERVSDREILLRARSGAR